MSFCPVAVFAQSFVVKAEPSIVAVNSKFQIVYTVEDTQPGNVESFIPPAFPDFTVIAGPTQSFSSISINGNLTESSVRYTYVVQTDKVGVFDIPVAEVKLKDGTSLKSKKAAVEVIKEDANKPGSGTGNSQGQSNPEDISPDDLFIRMEFNRQSVYKGEPLILTIKLYWRNVPVVGVMPFNMSTLAGFDFQQLQVSAAESNQRQQKYNNRIYNTVTLARLILHPLRAGEITLASIEAAVKIQVPQQSRATNDMFDIFIGPQYKVITKQLKSAPVTLGIKDFPAGAPASFNGATGNFTLATKVDKDKIVANQAITYSVTVSGTGNFKQVNPPPLSFPDKFDKYDPTTAENVKTTETGGSGSKKFDYVLIPRSAGEYELPAVEFSYFDTRRGSYVTLKSDPIHLEVEKDPGGANIQPIASMPMVTGKKIEHLGNDILFIKTTLPSKLNPSGYVFFGSSDFWLFFAAIILVFAIICFVRRKMAKDRQNVALMRNKKANKVAIGRLKQSAKLLKADDPVGFYEEVAKAVWGYISDKLNMQGAEFSRDKVQEKLASQNIPQENIDLLIAVMENCEYARYAPGGSHKGMEDMYNEAIKAISRLENLK
ncbi:MAG: BatD family protein [Prevotellaceae bacterium]|nr:BatD family protein [Prevotellaceae bacterium]